MMGSISEEQNVSASAPESGDPTAISPRVRRIDRIVQLRGSFERFPQEKVERLTALLREPECSTQLPDGLHLAVTLNLEFEGLASSGSGDLSPERKVVRIASTYLVVYELDPGPQPAAADLEAFAVVNGQFNVWPYWRQYVQDCLARVELPPFMLPPFNPARLADRSDRPPE
jgi:hypothetical protein